ncbi:MAG: hypothetical protein ACJAS4_002615 [Bacteriovoracaceae bacterium]
MSKKLSYNQIINNSRPASGPNYALYILNKTLEDIENDEGTIFYILSEGHIERANNGLRFYPYKGMPVYSFKGDTPKYQHMIEDSFFYWPISRFASSWFYGQINDFIPHLFFEQKTKNTCSILNQMNRLVKDLSQKLNFKVLFHPNTPRKTVESLKKCLKANKVDSHNLSDSNWGESYEHPIDGHSNKIGNQILSDSILLYL